MLWLKGLLFNKKIQSANKIALEGTGMRRNALICGLLIIFFSSLDYTRFASGFINLRWPIYLVTDSSFWSGCESDLAGYEACRAFRIKQINDGVDDWFGHFDEATRPQVVIVYSKADLPSNPINDPIYLKIKGGYCGMATSTEIAAACYYNKFISPPVIVFDLPKNITSSTFAHEFGHALGREHEDVPKDNYSIMSYTHDSGHIIPIDIKIMCKMHSECPPHEDTWCQGSFLDKCRCPSASFEEGQILYEAGQLYCL